MQTTIETTRQRLIREAADLLRVPVPDLQDEHACWRWIEQHRDALRRKAAQQRRGRLRAISEAKAPDADKRLARSFAAKRRARKDTVTDGRRQIKGNTVTAEQIALVDRLYRGQLRPRSGTDADRLIKKALAFQARKRGR